MSLTRGLNRGHIGFAFIGGTISCMALTHVFKPDDRLPGIVSDTRFKATATIWFTVLAFSILPLLDSFANYYLSLTYFMLISLLSLIIVYQILATRTLTNFMVFTIFAEVVLLAVYLSASVLYMYPAPIGNDAVFHVDYLSSIISSGNLYSSPYVDQYANFPVYQLIFAGITLLSGTNLQSTQLSLAVVQVLAVAFVFLVGAKFLNVKIALLSTLLITLSSQMIIPRYSFYPSNFAIVYYMLLLFVLLYSGAKKPGIWTVSLIVIPTIGLVHPIILIVTTFTIVLGFILSVVLNFRDVVDIRCVLLSALVMLVQFTRPIPHSDSMVSKLSLYVAGTLSRSTSVSQATMSQSYAWTEVLLYDMGFTLLIFFGVCGALFVLIMCQKRLRFNPDYPGEKMIFLSSTALLITPIPYALAIVSPQMMPDRWFVFITVFLGLFSAVTIYFFSQLSNKIKLLMYLIVPLIVFFSITTPICNPNTHIYLEEMSTMPTLTESEMKAAEFFKNTVDLNTISANSLFAVRIDFSLSNSQHFIDPNKTYDSGVLLIRDYDMDNGFTVPMFGHNGKLLEIVKPTSAFTGYIDNASKFYENGKVRAVLGYTSDINTPGNLSSQQPLPSDEGA